MWDGFGSKLPNANRTAGILLGHLTKSADERQPQRARLGRCFEPGRMVV